MEKMKIVIFHYFIADILSTPEGCWNVHSISLDPKILFIIAFAQAPILLWQLKWAN